MTTQRTGERRGAIPTLNAHVVQLLGDLLVILESLRPKKPPKGIAPLYRRARATYASVATLATTPAPVVYAPRVHLKHMEEAAAITGYWEHDHAKDPNVSEASEGQAKWYAAHRPHPFTPKTKRKEPGMKKPKMKLPPTPKPEKTMPKGTSRHKDPKKK